MTTQNDSSPQGASQGMCTRYVGWNALTGNDNILPCDYNKIRGQGNFISGNDNTVTGHYNYAYAQMSHIETIGGMLLSEPILKEMM